MPFVMSGTEEGRCW